MLFQRDPLTGLWLPIHAIKAFGPSPLKLTYKAFQEAKALKDYQDKLYGFPIVETLTAPTFTAADINDPMFGIPRTAYDVPIHYSGVAILAQAAENELKMDPDIQVGRQTIARQLVLAQIRFQERLMAVAARHKMGYRG